MYTWHAFGFLLLDAPNQIKIKPATKGNRTMLKRKPYVEQHKTAAESQLVIHEETLKSIGMTEKQIQRDSRVRHIKGKIRQAKQQLAGIAELEVLIARKAEIKLEKQALEKVSQPKKRRAPEPEVKKAKKVKKEKKMAAAGAEE
jgi:hypothetical protein